MYVCVFYNFIFINYIIFQLLLYKRIWNLVLNFQVLNKKNEFIITTIIIIYVCTTTYFFKFSNINDRRYTLIS